MLSFFLFALIYYLLAGLAVNHIHLPNANDLRQKGLIEEP